MGEKTQLCLDCTASLVNIDRNQHCGRKWSLPRAQGSRLSSATTWEQTLHTGSSEHSRKRKLTSRLRDGLRPAGKPHADSLNIRCLQGVCQESAHNFIPAEFSDKFLRSHPGLSVVGKKRHPYALHTRQLGSFDTSWEV